MTCVAGCAVLIAADPSASSRTQPPANCCCPNLTIIPNRTEHEVVEGVVESLKVITYEKSLRTAQYAFEFAYLNHRKKVRAVIAGAQQQQQQF